MSELEARRTGIANHLGLDPSDPRVDAAIDSFDWDAPEPSDPVRAELHRLLRAYRDLRIDRNNVRLAETGEVFAPEDDA